MKVFLVVVLVGDALFVGWQVGSREVANLQLQGDLHDLALQIGVNATYSAPKTDEDFQNAVILKAKKRGIDLKPDEVTVQRSGSGGTASMYLAADYSETVNLPGYSFVLHFKPTSTN